MLVKLVVGVKKVGTFLGQNIRARRLRLTDFTKNCLYVGRKETFAAVENLISGSEVLRNACFTEACGDIAASVKDALNNDVKAILFDTSAFSYDEILDWMYDRASEGMRYTIGLYSEGTGKLITEYETL